jgi:hypothetical protein
MWVTIIYNLVHFLIHYIGLYCHGEYEYQRLPVGLYNSPDIFQEKLSILGSDLECFHAHIDDLLITNKGTWQQHMEHVDMVWSHLQNAGLKVNAKKSFFGKTEVEYLGYWFTRQGIQPVIKKIDAIQNKAKPSTKKKLPFYLNGQLLQGYVDQKI